jgi:DNA-binding NtrC family response regulator
MRRSKKEETSAEILIVDDVPANLRILSDALEPEGYQILAAPSGEVALQIVKRAMPDLIILDVLMPGIDGFETCRKLKESESTRNIPVIFVTAKGETQDVVEGFRTGGVDYITKPFEKEEVLSRVRNHLEISRLTRELRQMASELLEKNRELEQEIIKREQAEKDRDEAEDARRKSDERLSLISEQEAKRWGIEGFIGKSKTVADILDNIRRLHNTDTTHVLVTGESGTGKELIARAIHFGGIRARGPFIPVNCSAIPAELAESEFFGHVKGAFTGAISARRGYFEMADGGTLFLDEIGDMPVELQAKLLRVLEDGLFTPVGGTRERRVDIRILSATNTDLEARIEEGTFRSDLYFRLARFRVDVPPLREHPEDIPLLTDHFLNLFAAEMGIRKPDLSQEALVALTSYSFPGNVRELKNVMERALIESRGTTIQPEHLHFLSTSTSNGEDKLTATEVLPSEINELYRRMAEDGENFWDVVHEPFMARELNRLQIKAVIRKGLEEVWGSYKSLMTVFGLPESDYQKFMDFLRHHDLKPTQE